MRRAALGCSPLKADVLAAPRLEAASLMACAARRHLWALLLFVLTLEPSCCIYAHHERPRATCYIITKAWGCDNAAQAISACAVACLLQAVQQARRPMLGQLLYAAHQEATAVAARHQRAHLQPPPQGLRKAVICLCAGLTETVQQR